MYDFAQIINLNPEAVNWWYTNLQNFQPSDLSQHDFICKTIKSLAELIITEHF